MHLINLHLQTSERLQLENKSSKDAEDEEYECYVCNANLYVSLVKRVQIVFASIIFCSWLGWKWAWWSDLLFTSWFGIHQGKQKQGLNSFRQKWICIINCFDFQIRHCKLLYTHTLEEIKDILIKVDQRLKNKNYAEVKVWSIFY